MILGRRCGVVEVQPTDAVAKISLAIDGQTGTWNVGPCAALEPHGKGPEILRQHMVDRLDGMLEVAV